MSKLALLAPAVTWAPSVLGEDAPPEWFTEREVLELARQRRLGEAEMAKLRLWLAALSAPRQPLK